ncbi:P-loop containing nucleoside triphosphate hydrolase protein [Suillus subluteus]|nr:P-loop containing nucleoside triphosphate hydrolase protein [Suillus subluteus]
MKQTSPWGRNIVIFGKSGAGKSSIINTIAREQLAETSNDTTGCTSGHKCHPVTISGQRFVLFDTVGLGEGPAGTVPDAEAKRQLKSLLRHLMSSRSPSDGIDLLVYCVSSKMTTLPAIIRAYETFYSRVCRKKVPIVIVMTGLENKPDMESWWDTNKGKFKSMHFTGHACVTALQEYPEIPDDFTRRIAKSSEILRNLLVNNCSHWAVDDSWSDRIARLWCASSKE